MDKTKLSEEELRKAYTHVQYEFSMLQDTSRLLQQSHLIRPAERAVLESFVIHTRNLLEFLYGTHPRPTDITPEDFVAANAWQTERPKESDILEIAYERAHKEVAHLTYTRLSAADKNVPWPVPKIAQEISAAFNKFVELAKARHPDLIQAPFVANVVSVSSTVTFRHTTASSEATTLELDAPDSAFGNSPSGR